MSAHTVVDGVIQRLSVSSIEKFDERTTWGCEARWWFRYVLRAPEPQTTAQGKGQEIHAQIEHYLKTGQDVLGPIARVGKHAIPEPGPDLMVEQEISGDELTALEIPLIGKIDLVNTRDGLEILDWKTTSDIARNAKTPKQLRTSTQMLGYAKWALNRFPEAESVRLSHGYFQTSGPKAFEKVTCEVDRKTVTIGWSKVESELVARMVEVAKKQEPQSVKGNLNACKVGRSWCPYIQQCPHANPLLQLIQGPTNMPSLLDRFAVDPASVLAPDAPKSDPKLAADPVPGFTSLKVGGEGAGINAPVPVTPPAPELKLEPALPDTPPKKTRKTKIKDESKTPDIVTTVATVEVKRIVIRHGATLNMGNYQSAKVEVEMEAEGCDREALSLKVREALAAECAVYAAPKEKA